MYACVCLHEYAFMYIHIQYLTYVDGYTHIQKYKYI